MLMTTFKIETAKIQKPDTRWKSRNSVIVFTDKCIIHWNETEMQEYLHCLKFI